MKNRKEKEKDLETSNTHKELKSGIDKLLLPPYFIRKHDKGHTVNKYLKFLSLNRTILKVLITFFHDKKVAGTILRTRFIER